MTDLLSTWSSFSTPWKAVLVLVSFAFGVGQAWLVFGSWTKRIGLVSEERAKLTKNVLRLRERLNDLEANLEPDAEEFDEMEFEAELLLEDLEDEPVARDRQA